MLRAFLPTSQVWRLGKPCNDDLSACRPGKKPGGRRRVRAKPTHWTSFFETLESRTLLAGNPGSSLFINDVAVIEGNAGTVNANFTVSLASASSQVVTEQYSTSNGTATAPSDYTTTSGTLSYSPGETMKTVSVPVIGDTLVEQNETF